MRFQVLKLSQAHQEAPLTCKILEPCAEQLHFHVVEVGIQHVRVQSQHRETLSTGLSTCSEIRFLSPSLKKSSNDFPAKPPTFGAVWRSIDESWPESLRATSPLAPHSRLASQKMRWLQLQLFATPCCHYMVKENKKETTRRWAK